jgi:NADPH2:quinone reductase
MLTPFLLNLTEAQNHQVHILQQAAQWFEEGKLKIHVGQTFPLKNAIAAHQSLEIGSTTGKIVLIIDE